MNDTDVETLSREPCDRVVYENTGLSESEMRAFYRVLREIFADIHGDPPGYFRELQPKELRY